MNRNEFICLEITAAPAQTDRYVEILWELGTIGLQESGEADRVRLKAYFPGDVDESAIREQFLNAAQIAGFQPAFSVSTTLSDPDDWVENYKKNFHGFAVGERFWIHPSWENPSETRPINLVIDPGHAFGTGTHESTQLCLLMMEELTQTAESLLDVGTGSGILAIAARRLNPALPIVAFDVDLQAIEMARENIERNGSDRLLLFAGPPEAVKRRFDLVVANLAFGIFQRVGAAVADLAGRHLIISGFTTDQADSIRELFVNSTPSGLALAEKREANGWVSMRFSRPQLS